MKRVLEPWAISWSKQAKKLLNDSDPMSCFEYLGMTRALRTFGYDFDYDEESEEYFVIDRRCCG